MPCRGMEGNGGIVASITGFDTTEFIVGKGVKYKVIYLKQYFVYIYNVRMVLHSVRLSSFTVDLSMRKNFK